MMRVSSALLTLAVAGGVTLHPTVLWGQDPEFRAMWVTRFEWPHADRATCQAKIDSVMQTLAAHHFNAVFFQIRGQCDVFYPSPEEVWSPLIGGADPGWDPLAYAISAAHAAGIEFHAYINTHTCWLASGGALPANPNHLFYRHCNAADPAHRDWLICDSHGNPVQWAGSYVWIAPGIPDFQAYWRRQVMHVVRNYDVDGVHFDRIRTPGSSYSYDPISRARLVNSQSNPNALDFAAWTADQTTRLVRDIYAEIMAVKPQIVVSAAVFSNPATSPTSVYQDSLVWAQAGGMDLLVPMMYYTGGAGSGWDTTLQAWLAGSAGRHVVAGHNTPEGVAELLAQVELTRTRGGQGNSIFSYNSFTGWSDYLAEVYQAAVATPVMTWKSNPTTGIVYGYVRDAQGVPVVDAQVSWSGSTYKALSSGDGFYSFLLVLPGTYTVTTSHIGYDPVSPAQVTVAAGAVTRLDITLGSLLPPIIAAVSPDPDSAVRGREYVCQLTLAQGIADSWSLLQGPSGATVDNVTGLVRWVPMPSDSGRLMTFSVQASSAAGSDEATWNVQVELMPACGTFGLAGFEEYSEGTRVMFRNPRYSGSSAPNLAPTPDVSEVTEAIPAFGGSKCYMLQWEYLDTSLQRWARVTTAGGAYIPNPTVDLNRPIRLRLRLDSGRLRLSVGIRETGTTADLGADGDRVGSIEFLGAAAKVDGAPQGVLIEPMLGQWQTFTFDPRNDPIVAFTGDGVLSTPSGKGTLECLAFSIVDGVGPYTVYLDEIDFLCDLPGDFDHDGDVDLSDFGYFQHCFSGPGNPFPDGCRSADFDLDGDLDGLDFDGYRGCFNGANQPPGCW